MKVIFMGTPNFAVPSLGRLINSHHEVVAVFTQRPKARGRGLQESVSPVHKLAIDHKLDVYTPKTLRSEEVIRLIDTLHADVVIVVAYGFIVPAAMLSSKKYGCLNIHPSSLPRHRGAAPLQRTIIDGDTTTSVCVMHMDEGLDTGDILLRRDFELPCRITFSELHDVCANIGAELLLEVLDNIDHLVPTPQSLENVSYAHKLTKVEGRVVWDDSAYSLDCKIRGMNPWPSVYFEYNNKMIKILEAEYIDKSHTFIPGTIVGNKLEVACGTGILVIKKLQQEGSRSLTTDEFLRGTKIPVGTILV